MTGATEPELFKNATQYYARMWDEDWMALADEQRRSMVHEILSRIDAKNLGTIRPPAQDRSAS